VQSALQLRFGRPAIELGARAVPTLAGEVRIAFRPGALDPALRGRLGGWARILGGRDAASESWLVAGREALEEAARECDLAARLLAAQLGIEAQPAPPQLMGILNVTPDSFSDGGLHFEPARAIEAGRRMALEGARWIDVGGESTRPGAEPVPCEEELRRVLPVLRTLADEGCARLSIDTRHARVAEAALDAGATMVNDVGAGLDDERMLEVVRGADCRYVLMHRRGDPRDMQRTPRYEDPVAEICEFLRGRAAACIEAGIGVERLLVDPGIGFGKTLAHNLEVLARLVELRSLGLPLLVGPSRKSFIGHVTGAQAEADWARRAACDDPSGRLGGTAAAITFCVRGGAEVLRVHDVATMA
jgi:dihydropteroate synthase